MAENASTKHWIDHPNVVRIPHPRSNGNSERLKDHQGEAYGHRFLTACTLLSEVKEFYTLRRAFLVFQQRLYPHKCPDAVSWHYLYFTQLPRQKRVHIKTGLSEGFHDTIQNNTRFKNISRNETRGASVERLWKMKIPLGTNYSNPIMDINLNAIT